MITVVLPTYNEEGNLESVVRSLKDVLYPFGDYELFFIDDGSQDKSLEIIKALAMTDPKIKYISFSRNFGHQYALRAGLENALGDCVISMDCDLQHPIELLPEMIHYWKAGFQIVYTKRIDTENIGFFKKTTSLLFYKILNFFSEVKIETATPDFRLLDRKVIEEIKNLREYQFFLRGFIPWLGYKQKLITFIPKQRTWGKSGYSLKKMLHLALSGLTSFSSKPLTLITIFGLTMVIPSFFYGLYAIYQKIFTNNFISGWASILVSILFLGGVQLICLGVIGHYIGHIFLEVKKRPSYIIQEKNF